MSAAGTLDAGRMRKHRARKRVNAIALTLSLAAMAFGLFWLVWILVETVRLGIGGLNLAVFTEMTPPPQAETGGLANAIFGSLLTSNLDSNLKRLVSPESLNGISSDTLTGSPEVVRNLPAAVHAGVVEAFSLALGDVFLLAVPFIIVAFGLTWLLREVPLRENTHVHFDAD